MSNECCKEFTGWVKSFTRLERALTLLEAVLLVVLVAVLVLLILHLIVCSKPDYWVDDLQSTTPFKTVEGSITAEGFITAEGSITGKGPDRPINILANETGQSDIYETNKTSNGSTIKPDPKCSWTPSAKTKAALHYYEDGHTRRAAYVQTGKTDAEVTRVKETDTFIKTRSFTEPTDNEITGSDASHSVTLPFDDIEDLIQDELSEGEEADNDYDRHVVALVKLKPPKDIIFGCILTIVSEYWSLTAASCIEAIEETDSLDSFVIMEHYGTDRKGPLKAVDDVQIHPLYEGRNKTYDLAALKSTSSLTRDMRAPVELATFLDFALLTLAHRFIILGYGAFRTIDSGPMGRRLRQAHVYKLSERQCGGGGARAGAALRHLSGGSAVVRGACPARALCAGVLYSRGLPCTYCAGTPLLARARGSAPALLGVMADSEQCAAACEPALYVNLADTDIADWVDATLRSDPIH